MHEGDTLEPRLRDLMDSKLPFELKKKKSTVKQKPAKAQQRSCGPSPIPPKPPPKPPKRKPK